VPSLALQVGSGTPNFQIIAQSNPPSPPPNPPGVSNPPPPINAPPPPPGGPALLVGLPYLISDLSDPALLCRSDNATTNVWCASGQGTTPPEQFEPYNVGDPYNLADIPDGSQLNLRSVTGQWCIKVAISLTRNGIICNQPDILTAYAFTYAQGTVFDGSQPIMTDGYGWPAYFGSIYQPLNSVLVPGPLQPPSPPPPPPFPPFGAHHWPHFQAMPLRWCNSCRVAES
jgi:hypothetical protein